MYKKLTGRYILRLFLIYTSIFLCICKISFAKDIPKPIVYLRHAEELLKTGRLFSAINEIEKAKELIYKEHEKILIGALPHNISGYSSPEIQVEKNGGISTLSLLFHRLRKGGKTITIKVVKKDEADKPISYSRLLSFMEENRGNIRKSVIKRQGILGEFVKDVHKNRFRLLFRLDNGVNVLILVNHHISKKKLNYIVKKIDLLTIEKSFI